METQRLPFPRLPDLKQSAVITGWGRVAARGRAGGNGVDGVRPSGRPTGIPLHRNGESGQTVIEMILSDSRTPVYGRRYPTPA